MTTRRMSTRRRRVLVPHVFEPSNSPKGSGSSSSSLEDSDSAEDWKPAKAGKKRKMVRRRKNRAFISSSDTDSSDRSDERQKRDTKRKKRAKRSKLGMETGEDEWDGKDAEETQEEDDGEEKDENLPVKKAGKMKSTESLGDDVMPNQKIKDPKEIPRGTDSQMEKLAESGLKANGPNENVKQNPKEIPKEKPDMSTDPKKRDPPVQRNLIAPNTCQTPVQEIPRGTDSEMKDLANSALEVNGAKENLKEKLTEKLMGTPYTPTDPEKTVLNDLPVEKTRKMKSTESPGQDVMSSQEFNDPKEIPCNADSEMEIMAESGMKANGTKEKLTTEPDTPTDSNDLPTQKSLIAPKSASSVQQINNPKKAPIKNTVPPDFAASIPCTMFAMNVLLNRMRAGRNREETNWESSDDEVIDSADFDGDESVVTKITKQVQIMDMEQNETPEIENPDSNGKADNGEKSLLQSEGKKKKTDEASPKPSGSISEDVIFLKEVQFVPITATMNVRMEKVPKRTPSILDDENSTSRVISTLKISKPEWMVKTDELPRRGDSGGSPAEKEIDSINGTKDDEKLKTVGMKDGKNQVEKGMELFEIAGNQLHSKHNLPLPRPEVPPNGQLPETSGPSSIPKSAPVLRPEPGVPHSTAEATAEESAQPSAPPDTPAATSGSRPPPSSPQLTPEIRYEGIPLPTAAPSIPHCGDVYILLNSECKEHGMVPDFYVRTVKELGFELTAEDLEPKTSISANAAGQQIFFGRFQIRKSDVNKEFSTWLNAVERDEMIDQKNKQKYGDDKGKFVYIYKYYNDHDSAACVFLHKLFLLSAPTPGIRILFSAKKCLKWSSGENGKVLSLEDFFSGEHDELVREIHGGFTRSGRKMITEVTARLGVPRSFWRREAQNRLG